MPAAFAVQCQWHRIAQFLHEMSHVGRQHGVAHQSTDMQEHEHHGRDGEGEAHRQRSTDLRDRDRFAEQQIFIRGRECRGKQVEPNQLDQERSALRRLRTVVHGGD